LIIGRPHQHSQHKEKTVQSSAEQPTTIFECITDGVVALDTAWLVTYTNAEAARLFGCTQQELLGHSWWNMFPYAQHPLLFDAMQHTLRKQTTTTVEEYYPSLNRWFEIRAYPSPTGLLILFRDIAQRTQAAAELERLKQHHALILNSVAEGIFGVDLRGIITFANPSAAAMLGYNESELIGQHQHALIHHTRSNGTPYPAVQSPIVLSMRDGVLRYVETDVFWTKHDTSFPAAYTSTPLRERGMIVGAVVTFQNIAERKRIEAQQATQFAVTRVMAEADTLQDAVARLLQAVCVGMDWDLGELWGVDRDARLLRRIGGWYALTVHAVDFEIASRAITFGPEQGLPGHVWASGEPVWTTNVITEPSFVRAELAADHGFYTAFGVPVRNGREVTGVLVCFSRAMRQRDDSLVRLMSDLGSQIGQYLERRQAEAAVERSAARLATLHQIDRAILAAESPREIAAAALRHVWDFVPYRRAMVEMHDHATGTTHVLAVTDRSSLIGVAHTKMAQHGGQHHHAANGASADDAALRVPLFAHGVETGALTVVGAVGQVWNAEQRSVLREVAAQLAIAIEHARLWEHLQAANERLHVLSARLLQVQEAERRHLARELHDEIGQALTAIQLNLQDVGALSNIDALPERVEDSLQLVETVLQQVRSLSLDLRPSMLDDLGLAAAIRWYAKRQAERAKLQAHIEVAPIMPRPAPDIEAACYRVAQEAVTNIVRYALATDMYLDLAVCDNTLVLVVRDNGVGFDVGAAREHAVHGESIGMLGMQERAQLVGGQCSVMSTLGKGTVVRAQFPLNEALPMEYGERSTDGTDARVVSG